VTIYTLNLKDGSAVQVEAPRGTPIEELIRLANQQMGFTPLAPGARPESTRERDELIAQRLAEARKRAPLPEPEEEDDGTALGRGLSRGVDIMQQAYGSALEGLGFEELGGDIVARNEAQLRDTERQVESFRDIEGVGTLGTYMGEVAGESAPQMGAAGLGALIGGIAGSAIPVVGTTLGAAAGATLANLPFFYGMNRERQKEAIERGERVEMSEGAAALTAVPQSALDAIITALGAKFIAKPAAEIGGGLLTRAATGAGAGAAVEVPTEIGQQVLERMQAGLPLADEEAINEYAEAGVAAGLLGGTVGGVAGAAKRGAPQTEPEAEEQRALPAPEGIAGLLPDQRASQARERIAQALDEKGDVELSDMQDIVEQTQIPLPELERVVSEEMEKRGAAMAERSRVEMEQELDELTAPSDRPPSRMQTAVADVQAGRSAVESDIARNEQAAQAAAREREAERAAQRGDVAAFEQPDLFALEQEQERRRLGPEETRRPDQFMDTEELLFEAEEQPTIPAAERDLVDLIRQDETQEASAAVRRGRAAAQEADLAARTEAETAERVAPMVQAAEEAPFRQAAGRRQAIVDDVLSKSTSSSIVNTERTVQKALADAGVKRTGLSRNEKLAVKRKVAELKQQRPIQEPDAPKSREQLELEQRVAPKGVNLLPEQEGTDAARRLQTKGTGRGVPSSAGGMGQRGGRGLRADEDTQEPTAPVEGRLGRRVPDAGVPPVATGKRKRALAPSEQDLGLTPEEVASLESVNQPRPKLTGRARAEEIAAKARDPERRRQALAEADRLEKAQADALAEGERLRKEDKAKFKAYEEAGMPIGAEYDAWEANYEAQRKDDGSTGRAGQVIPGVARSKTTGKKLAARQTRFQPKPTKKRTPEKTQKQKASEAFDKIHKQRPDSVQKESAEAVRTSSPVPDYIDTKDQKRIYDEVSKPRTGKTGVRNALYKYFSQYRRPEDAIEAILNDSLYFDAERKASDFAHSPRQAEFYGANPDENLPSTGKTAATKALNWLRQNLRPETVQQINDRIDIPMRDAFVDLYSQKESTFTKGVAADLKAGKLEDALKTLSATLPNRNLRRIATKLLQNIGDAKVKVVDNLKAEDGRLLHGEYDPQTNTITLDATRGMTPHTLLHEMVHATTSAALANKSHPLRRKMLNIYERAKDELGDVDGMESVEEFYAEALSNPAFQNMLQTTGGKGTSIWKQLTTAVRNVVRNMMGMSAQRADVRTGIQTEIDNLVEDLISPTIPSRDASKLYMAVKTPKDAINYINNLGPRTQKADKNYYERARDFIGGNLPKLAKEVYLKTQPLNIVAQVTKSKIAEAPLLNDLVNGMSASLRKMNTKMEPLVNDIKDFRKKNPDKYMALSRLVPYASYERVDPRAADYKSAYSGTEDKRAIYKELRKEYNALGTEGKKLYDTITNFYENSLDNVMSAINANLEATISDGQARQRAFDKLAEQLNLTRGKIRPFSPLTRAGAYRLEYNSIDPRTGVIETFVERFETKRAREKAVQNLAEYNAKVSAKLQKSDPEKYKAVKQYLNAEPKRSMSDTVRDFRDAPPSSFVYNVLQTLSEAGVKDQQVINQIVDLALDSMPEHSFMQSFRKRRDIRGFLGDVTPTGVAETAFDLLDTVQTKGRDYNRQIVQMEYGAQIQKWKNEVNAKYSDADEELTLYKDTLFKIANFAQRPNVSRASQILTSTGYAWTMGLNFSSAAITFFDVGMSALPRMAGTYGDVAAAKALGRAAKLLAQAPRTYKVDAYGPNGEVKRQLDSGFMGASISHYDFDSKDLPEGMSDLRYLVEAGIDHAQFGQSLNQEQLDIGQSKDRLEMINKATSFLFHHAERYNREVVMTANYMLELDKLKESGKPVTAEDKRAAAIKAIDETEFTLGATASAGRPVVAQNAVGNVAFLFKRFAMSKYYMMARMFDEAFVKAIDPKDVEARSAARHSLARFLGITGLMSGVGGLPMMGAMGMIYDLFAADDEDDFEAATRKVLGEGVWEGIINEALGVEVASRISMNSLLYRPPFIEKDQSQLWTLIEQLGGPVVGITLSAERGIGLWADGEWWRGTEAVMPAAVRNVLKGYRFATAGAETRRGDAIMEDVSPWNVINQGLGFAPADYIRTLEYNQNEKRKDEALKGERRRVLRKLNMAAVEGDREGYREALKEIREYNKGLKGQARRKVILPETMLRSRRAFLQTTGRMKGGVEYTPNMLESLREYDQGLQLFNWE
jgi:hypothetical protein